MKDEIFDLVNDRDEVIGRELRREVHRLGLRHRAVHVLVFNAAGKVLLQKRSMTKDTFPGVWDSSASGHLECGEDYDPCAMRELREELGWTPVESPVRLFKLDACDRTGQEFVWVYRVTGEGPFTPHPEEIDELRWIDAAELTGWMARAPGDFAPALVAIWERVTVEL